MDMEPNPHPLCDERGAALIVAMLAALLLTALGSGLALLTTAEIAISANYRAGQEVLYAADAGLEVAAQDLLNAPQWNDVLQGRVRSGFTDDTLRPILPDGSPLDLTMETRLLQWTTDTADVWDANNPRWRLYAFGALEDLFPGVVINDANYIAVWVSDDPSDDDGDPLRDTNGLLTLRAQAFGPFNTKRVVEATVTRSTVAGADSSLTAQRGQGALNQRESDQAVQTPGTTLTRSSMNLGTGGMRVQ